MSDFSPEVAAELLAACRRHCCLCLGWAGQRMHIHHITPQSKGGTGEADNGIPVCLDCHAEIESTSNMGRKFSALELRMLRDAWFDTVKNRPEVLIRSAHSATQTGPLQALLAELDFNRVAIRGEKMGSPPLQVKQFERALATDALAALDSETREGVLTLYACIARHNHAVEELMRMQRFKTEEITDRFPFIAPLETRNAMRTVVQDTIPAVMTLLARALGAPHEPS